MEYSVNKTYDDYKNYITITFAESVIDYFRNNQFNIGIDDIIRQSYITITSFTDLINNYSIKPDTAEEFTTIDNQLNNSLIKNNGLVITFIDNKTLQFILIPRCTSTNNPDKLIGFSNTNITIHVESNPPTDITANVALYPYVTRENTLIPYYSNADPVLPNNIDRCCYTYPNIYENGKEIRHNISYPTDSQIYVNTTSSASPDPDSSMVPVYFSKITAGFTKESSSGIMPDWSDESVSSVLYNDKNLSYIAIPWEFEPERCLVSTPTAISQTSGMVNNQPNIVDNYTMRLSAYKIRQYVYADNLPAGRYENNLFFGLNVTQDPSYVPPTPVEQFTKPEPISSNMVLKIYKYIEHGEPVEAVDRELKIYTVDTELSEYGYDTLKLDLSHYPFLTNQDTIIISRSYQTIPYDYHQYPQDKRISISTTEVNWNGPIIDLTPDGNMSYGGVGLPNTDINGIDLTINVEIILNDENGERANNIRTMYEIDIEDPAAAGWDKFETEVVWTKHIVNEEPVTDNTEEPATDNTEEETNNE